MPNERYRLANPCLHKHLSKCHSTTTCRSNIGGSRPPCNPCGVDAYDLQAQVEARRVLPAELGLGQLNDGTANECELMGWVVITTGICGCWTTVGSRTVCCAESMLLERGTLFRRLFVLRHHCCSSAATSRRHCFSHRTLHHSVWLYDRL